MTISWAAALIAAIDAVHPGSTVRAVLHPVEGRPVVGVTAAGDPIVLGGFSGLAFLGVDETTGALRFATHTDRGPNAEPRVSANERKSRPFALPRFQPELVIVEVPTEGGSARVVQRIGLVGSDGTMVSGLPPSMASTAAGVPTSMEEATDLRGAPITGDGASADLEGMARGADGSWWMCEEYRPSILRFDESGRLLERWVPQSPEPPPSSSRSDDDEFAALPAIYARRAPNRGFEGIAVLGNRLHAFLQGPLAPTGVPREALKRSCVVRVPVLDVDRRALVAEHVYLLDSPKHKIGDATVGWGGTILVLEAGAARTDWDGVAAQVHRVDVASATNLLALAPEVRASIEPLEARTPEELAAAGIVPLRKTLVVDCAAAGYTFARKPEGLAAIDATRIAIINDDDFGLVGTFDAATGRLAPNPSPQPVAIAVFTVNPTP